VEEFRLSRARDSRLETTIIPFTATDGGLVKKKSSMRKLHLSAAAIVAIAGPAFAADLAVKAPPMAPAFIASPWDGLYVGANVGFGNTDYSVSGVDLGTGSISGSGSLAGFQAGYNKQYGVVVVGLETDFDFASMDATAAPGATAKLPWFGTARTRVGYLINPSLLAYGSGGVAYSRAEVSGPGAAVKIPGVGWAAGSGLEYQLGAGQRQHQGLDGPRPGKAQL
jgi:outer membrane immunogenic protein